MTKKEFYLIAIIVIYTYFAIVFQVNLNNFSVDNKANSSFFNAFN